jgi:hypothetical protein
MPNSYRELIGKDTGENKSQTEKDRNSLEKSKTGLIKKLSMSPIKSHNFALK